MKFAVVAAILLIPPGFAAADGAIELAEGGQLLIRQILPADCRVVRGFTHAPADGREDTRYSNNTIGEWSGPQGTPAVNFRRFNGNNGLHVTFPVSADGFDALQVRGNWRGRVFLDSDSLTEPKTPPFCEIPQTQPFGERILARRVSFFRDEGALAQVSFFRVENAKPDGNPSPPLDFDAAWDDWTQAISAITLEFRATKATSFTVRVGDVLDSRRFATIVDLRVPGPGNYAVSLDVPDQVFLPPKTAWKPAPTLNGDLVPKPQLRVSVEPADAIELDSAKLVAHQIPRENALPEAVAWRKFLLRGLFSALSEPRPWMLLSDAKPIHEQIAANPAIQRYQPAILEVLETAEIARLLAPEDEIIAQFHDWLYQNLAKRDPHPAPVLSQRQGAPRWAVLVRDNWVEQAHIARWWLDHRLTPNGEFGGGPQDDTDLMQSWQCLPMIESEPLGAELKSVGAKLAAIMLEHHLEEGLNRRSMDALHAYEEGVNQLALNAWWNYGDPVHFERVMASARSVMRLMVETGDGRLHFASDRKVGIEQARNGYEEIGESPGTWNWAPIRLMFHPMFVVADYNQNPAVLARYAQWGETWADYQAPGAFVDKVDIKTGKPAGNSDALPPSANRSPVDEFLALYLLTGDPKWRRPFQMGIDGGGFNGAPIQYGRSIHHLVRWPEPYQAHLRANSEGGGYAGFFVRQDREMLVEWLEKSLSWFQRFRFMNTAAEQKTDRILTYNATTALSCYLGDAPNRNRWLNLGAVSYEDLRGEDFAALVWDAGPKTLRVALYNFADRELTGKMRVWRLEHGNYRLRAGLDRDDDGFIDKTNTEQLVELRRFSAIPLKLTPGAVTILEFEQKERLDPKFRQRADLALSLDGNDVRVHNIGGAEAADFRVIVRRGGEIVESARIATLAAPLDLHPRSASVPFKLSLKRGDAIEVDPDDRVPEITEHNNRLLVEGEH